MSLDIQKQILINVMSKFLDSQQKKIEFKDLQGIYHDGIVQNITPAQKTILVKTNTQNQPLKLWRFDQIASIRLPTVLKDGKFKTDSETVKTTKDRKTKTLVKWVEDDGKLESEQLMDFVPQNPFDQFEANQERFGVVATYDENSYTTELKLNQVNEKLKDFAEQQAYDLLKHSQGEKNRHVLEERNLKPLQDNLDDDEEAKYSAVMESGVYKKYQKKVNNKSKNKSKFPPGLSQVVEAPKKSELLSELEAQVKPTQQQSKFFNSNKSTNSDCLDEIQKDQNTSVFIPSLSIEIEQKPIVQDNPVVKVREKKLKLRKLDSAPIYNQNIQSNPDDKMNKESNMLPGLSINSQEKQNSDQTNLSIQSQRKASLTAPVKVKKSLRLNAQAIQQDTLLSSLDPQNISLDTTINTSQKDEFIDKSKQTFRKNKTYQNSQLPTQTLPQQAQAQNPQQSQYSQQHPQQQQQQYPSQYPQQQYPQQQYPQQYPQQQYPQQYPQQQTSHQSQLYPQKYPQQYSQYPQQIHQQYSSQYPQGNSHYPQQNNQQYDQNSQYNQQNQQNWKISSSQFQDYQQTHPSSQYQQYSQQEQYKDQDNYQNWLPHPPHNDQNR